MPSSRHSSEVAYNTLAKRDRKVRHLAAARFFESLETEELAGALAGHYLSAQGYATDGPEADALAAQARVALRGAAERAVALGSHVQAIAFLEHALAVSPDAGDRADLHERARASAMQGLVGKVAERHGLGALEARRELGDRAEIALATAAYAQAIAFFGTDGEPLLKILLPAWEEFSDLEATPAGVALMLQLATAYNFKQEDRTALEWLERLLPVAERLDLLADTAGALSRLAGTLWRLERPRESLILLRGTHELAVANGLVDVDRNARTSLSFREQFADPLAGLALAREGLEIASRRGSTSYGFMMVGNAVSCAIRAGEWAWASELLDEWLANEITGGFYLELYVDRAALTSLRGGDSTDDLAEAERLLPEFMSDSQYPSYVHWARAWAALTSDRLGEALQEATISADMTGYFVPISLPIAARAALWAGDVAAAGGVLARLEGSLTSGQAMGLDLTTLRAGLAALEGRRAEAVTGYRDALRGWRQLGLAFDEAMATLDLAILLAPTEREMAEAPSAIEWARETLTRIGARPLLARLDAALGVAPGGADGAVGAAGGAAGAAGEAVAAPARPVGTASQA
jgi:tetratricopeptide (TPR) repeat protein